MKTLTVTFLANGDIGGTPIEPLSFEMENALQVVATFPSNNAVRAYVDSANGNSHIFTIDDEDYPLALTMVSNIATLNIPTEFMARGNLKVAFEAIDSTIYSRFQPLSIPINDFVTVSGGVEPFNYAVTVGIDSVVPLAYNAMPTVENVGTSKDLSIKFGMPIGNLTEEALAVQADINAKSATVATNTNTSTAQAILATQAKNEAVSALSGLQTQVNSLSSGGPKGVYATVSALTTAYPTGNTNIYLVTADGKWYYWNGTTWTAGILYQSAGIADGSITYQMFASKAIADDAVINAQKPWSSQKINQEADNALANSILKTQAPITTDTMPYQCLTDIQNVVVTLKPNINTSELSLTCTSENKFDIKNLIAVDATHISAYENGVKLSGTNVSVYTHKDLVLQLDPNTTYYFSATSTNNTGNGCGVSIYDTNTSGTILLSKGNYDNPKGLFTTGESGICMFLFYLLTASASAPLASVDSYFTNINLKKSTVEKAYTKYNTYTKTAINLAANNTKKIPFEMVSSDILNFSDGVCEYDLEYQTTLNSPVYTINGTAPINGELEVTDASFFGGVNQKYTLYSNSLPSEITNDINNSKARLTVTGNTESSTILTVEGNNKFDLDSNVTLTNTNATHSEYLNGFKGIITVAGAFYESYIKSVSVLKPNTLYRLKYLGSTTDQSYYGLPAGVSIYPRDNTSTLLGQASNLSPATTTFTTPANGAIQIRWYLSKASTTVIGTETEYHDIIISETDETKNYSVPFHRQYTIPQVTTEYIKLIDISPDSIISNADGILNDITTVELCENPIYTVNGVKPNSNGELILTQSAYFKNKKIAIFGDSNIGNYQADGIPSLLQSELGITAYNVGFGATRMSTHPQAEYDAFCMHSLADAIESGDWTLQDSKISLVSASLAPSLPTIKAIDWATIDYVAICHGCNDWTNVSTKLDNLSDADDYTSFKGGFRYFYAKLFAKNPKIKVLFITSPYRGVTSGQTETCDTLGVAHGVDTYYLYQFIDATKELSKEFKLPYLDLFYEGGINSTNWEQYLSDGAHYTLEGRQIAARRLAEAVKGYF